MSIGPLLVEVLVPGPCVPAARARVVGKRAFTPEKYAAFKRTVSDLGAIAMRRRAIVLAGVPLHATVRFMLPIPATATRAERAEMLAGARRPVRGDIDNMAKSIFDGLNGIAYVDDKQIASAWLEKLYSDDPRTEVRIHALA